MEVLLVARVLLLRSMAGIFKQLPTHTTHMMYMTQTHTNPVSNTTTSLQRHRAQPRFGYRSPDEEMMWLIRRPRLKDRSAYSAWFLRQTGEDIPQLENSVLDCLMTRDDLGR